MQKYTASGQVLKVKRDAFMSASSVRHNLVGSKMDQVGH